MIDFLLSAILFITNETFKTKVMRRFITIAFLAVLTFSCIQARGKDSYEIKRALELIQDKEYDKALSYIAPLADTVITTTPSNPRALSAKELAEHASVYCKDTIAIDEPVVAYAHAKSCAAPSDCILICGSLYLASDIRPACLDIQ